MVCFAQPPSGTWGGSCVTVPLLRALVPPHGGLSGPGPWLRSQRALSSTRVAHSGHRGWAAPPHHGQIPSFSLSRAELGPDEGSASEVRRPGPDSGSITRGHLAGSLAWGLSLRVCRVDSSCTPKGLGIKQDTVSGLLGTERELCIQQLLLLLLERLKDKSPKGPSSRGGPREKQSPPEAAEGPALLPLCCGAVGRAKPVPRFLPGGRLAERRGWGAACRAPQSGVPLLRGLAPFAGGHIQSFPSGSLELKRTWTSF